MKRLREVLRRVLEDIADALHLLANRLDPVPPWQDDRPTLGGNPPGDWHERDDVCAALEFNPFERGHRLRPYACSRPDGHPSRWHAAYDAATVLAVWEDAEHDW